MKSGMDGDQRVGVLIYVSARVDVPGTRKL
jgi:hypothetical protein